MQQFIQMATSALGTSEQTARTLTGALLDVIAKAAPRTDVSALLDRLSGASDLLTAFRAAPPRAPLAPATDSGLLGSLSNAASEVLGTGATALGAGATGLAELAALFGQSGLEATRVPQLVTMFAQWATQQAGADLVRRTLGAVPGVTTILPSIRT
jgi:Protein of unknown function VcgC/VcgE (DUF2780)